MSTYKISTPLLGYVGYVLCPPPLLITNPTPPTGIYPQKEGAGPPQPYPHGLSGPPPNVGEIHTYEGYCKTGRLQLVFPLYKLRFQNVGLPAVCQ